MRHCVLVSLLTIVGLFSIGVGIHQHHGHCARHQAFEQHVADVCVQAARRALANNPTSNSNP
jgi:hypothetical protein